MKMFFPENNLPPESQDWAYRLERELKALKALLTNSTQAVTQEFQNQNIKISEAAKISSANVSPIKSFDFNVDGGMVNSNYGGLDPLDGGLP